MAKIAIDAGHGGTTDPGAVYQGRQEKDDNLRLALAVGEILQNSGQEVVYTRTEDVYQTPLQKATAANESGADLLISFHRNSSEFPNQYTGVETLVYDKSGQKLEIAEGINHQLENIGFRNIGVKERPGLVVLRRSKMPAVLVEAGFINSEEDNLLFDQEFDRIAQGIAQGILDTIETERMAETCPACGPGTGIDCPETDGERVRPGQGCDCAQSFYRVQTGAFKNRENALRQERQLENDGYPAFVVQRGDYYLVQVGAFRRLENAVRMEAALRESGYQTYITT